MEKQLIISVGREFGSGGHEIAERLSGHYKIRLLDHNLLDEIAAERSVDLENLKDLDEKHKKRLSSRTVRGFSSSPEENLYLMQFDFLKKKAAGGDSFVIVGRCSEDILKECEGLVSIFVHADKEKRIERIMEKYRLTSAQAEKLIREKDMKRKRYHDGFCKEKWGASRSYDISINSGKLGIAGTVDMLIDYIDKRYQI
ncbi:MAG: cytidylate kinase-like family protein [Lachnospiraceae bacterium]|nr:cytidylate kinase-like family protein [Lachnospiraceae bacterium]